MAIRATGPILACPDDPEHPERLPEHARLARSPQRSLRWMSVSSRDVTRKKASTRKRGAAGVDRRAIRAHPGAPPCLPDGETAR
eukprot:7023709-Prymnesium_polylepis.2